MGFNCLVDVVAIKSHHNGGVSGGRGERFREEWAVTLIDRLAEGDASERN